MADVLAVGVAAGAERAADPSAAAACDCDGDCCHAPLVPSAAGSLLLLVACLSACVLVGVAVFWFFEVWCTVIPLLPPRGLRMGERGVPAGA